MPIRKKPTVRGGGMGTPRSYGAAKGATKFRPTAAGYAAATPTPGIAIPLSRPMTSYLRLIDRFPLRPLRSDEELDRAVALVDELLDRRDLDPGEQDYLDTLALLVERYENEAHPIEPPSDGEMLGHLLEARGVNQAEAARGAGIAASTINEVLAGKRKLNRRHIGKLAAYFEVDPGVFAFRGD